MPEKLKGWICYGLDKKVQVSQITRINAEGTGTRIYLLDGTVLDSSHDMGEIIKRIREAMKGEPA